ncbi:MAG: rRNA maturation RNase YbeY [Candidatus Omnitrophica bacterium]|nr:rRNA maturation RNase YbeY [Candidatus Omnitrophota bacterium]
MEIEIIQKVRKIKINKEFLKNKLDKLKQVINPPPKKIIVYLVNNKTIKNLNRRFFKKNIPTDIISFKYSRNFGELIISIEQCNENAQIYKHSIEKELIYVIIHGILHLKGYKDYKEKERNEMFSVQDRIFSLII